MNESEQAQAIHQEFHEAMQWVWADLPRCHAEVIKSFVDSQAQKIAELNEYISQREAGCADCHDIKEHDYEW